MKASGAELARPNVDGWLLPTDVRAIFAEGQTERRPHPDRLECRRRHRLHAPTVKADAFEAQAKTRFGDQADAYLKIYPASSDEEAHKSSAAEAMRDQTFGWEMRTWARLQAKTGKSQVYLYYFSRVPPGPVGKKLGAYHASEIRYVFHNLSNRRGRGNRP